MFCFSPHSIKLTTLVQWFLHLAIVLARVYAEVHLYAVWSKTEHFWLGVYGRIVILKNCIACMKQHLDHSMHLVNWNVHIVTGSNLTIQRTSRIPRYFCLNYHRTISLFHSWNQVCRTIGFLGCCPNRNPAWCWEQHRWLIWPYYVSPVIRRLGFTIIMPNFSPKIVVFSNQFSHWSYTIGCWICEALIRLLLKQGL